MKDLASSGNCCQPAQPEPKRTDLGRQLKKVPSVLLSIVIAFFPKCPMCWAVYMSMLGGLGLSGIAYPAWLLPVLLGFMGVHLFLLFRKARREGYLPFFISLGGTAVLLCARFVFHGEKWMLLTGLGMIVLASLSHGFSRVRLTGFLYK